MKLTFAKVPISGRVDGPGFRVPDDRLTRLVTGTSGVNFINVLRACFSYERLFSSYVLALSKLSYKKCACKMLMKLTPGAELKDCQRFQVAKYIFNEVLAQLKFNDH